MVTAGRPAGRAALGAGLRPLPPAGRVGCGMLCAPRVSPHVEPAQGSHSTQDSAIPSSLHPLPVPTGLSGHRFIEFRSEMRLGACSEPGRDSSERGPVFGSPAGLCGCHPEMGPRAFGAHRPQPRGPALTPRRPPQSARSCLPGLAALECRLQVAAQWGLFSQQCLLPHAAAAAGPSLITLAALPAALSPASIPPAAHARGRGEPGRRARCSPLPAATRAVRVAPRASPVPPGSFPPPAPRPPALHVRWQRPASPPLPSPAQPARGRRQIQPAKQTPICPQRHGNPALATWLAQPSGCRDSGRSSPHPSRRRGDRDVPVPWCRAGSHPTAAQLMCLWLVCQQENCTKSSATSLPLGQRGQHGPSSLRGHRHLGRARPQGSSTPFSSRNGGQ